MGRENCSFFGDTMDIPIGYTIRRIDRIGR